MQPETLNRSIQPTPTVHPRGFTPRPVQLSMAVDTVIAAARVSPGGGGGPYRVSHQDALRRSTDLRGVVGGTSPPPAPAGDPRSVAPRGRLAHDL